MLKIIKLNRLEGSELESSRFKISTDMNAVMNFGVTENAICFISEIKGNKPSKTSLYYEDR